MSLAGLGLALEPAIEHDAVHEFRHDIEKLTGSARFVDVHNSRMIELGCNAGFAQEMVAFGGDSRIEARNLDGHRAVEMRVAGPPDGAKPARADFLDQFIVGDRQFGRRRANAYVTPLCLVTSLERPCRVSREFIRSLLQIWLGRKDQCMYSPWIAASSPYN